MRLSWYADTGVAVFSIWQGGMCTGTFRLPIGDLPRMIDILDRGPARSGPGAEHDWAGPESAYPSPRDNPTGSVLGPDSRYPERRRPGYGRDDLAETAAASYDAGDAPGYGQGDLADARRRGSGQGDRPDARGSYRPDDVSDARPGYGRDDRTDAQRLGYGRADPADVRLPGYRHDASAETSASFGRDTFSDGPYPGYQAEPRGAGSGERQAWDDAAQAPAGYGQERFVPPYVRGTAGEYVNDIPAQEAEMPTTGRRIAYRSDLEAGRSGVEDYQDPSWAQAGYSDEPRYRLPGEPAGSAGDRTGQHSAGRHTGPELNQRDPGGYTTGHGLAEDIHGEARDYRARRLR
jgi:hypothetical protein